jgi:hypothetical protein
MVSSPFGVVKGFQMKTDLGVVSKMAVNSDMLSARVAATV